MKGKTLPRSWGAPMHELTSVPVEVTRVVDETPTVRTIEFSRSFPARPGQFVMVWVPGIDEVPMALSSPSSITVQRIGEATAALCGLAEGDLIGIKGPLGRGFEISGRTLAVAGGVGAAPLRPLAASGLAAEFLLGARTSAELLFADELSRYTRLSVATDDGTAGHHGFVTELLEQAALDSFDHVCVCGPEPMMRGVLRILDAAGCPEKGLFSLHRYMKCGVGLCGSCAIDPSGLCVCREGPVFSGDVLLDSEFGHYARDACGIRRKI
jgi:dihydroorotate dehydrogenase electron transfer subunit